MRQPAKKSRKTETSFYLVAFLMKIIVLLAKREKYLLTTK